MQIVSFLFYSLVLLIIVFSLLTLGYAGLSFAPWVPSRKKDFQRIFKLANLQPGEVFYELGCGDGRLTAYAVKNFSVKAVGLEIALPFFLICQWRRLFVANKKNLTFKCKNLFNENLAPADVIYLFGMPKPIQEKLQQKIKAEVRPGTRVVSYAFSFPDWTPLKVDKPTIDDIAIYLYQL